MNLKNYLFLIVAFSSLSIHLSAKDIYVSTTGSDNNDGSESAPLLTINKAVDIVEPGDQIWVRGGTYMLKERIKIAAKQNATEDARIKLWGYPGERVIIDGSQIVTNSVSEFKMARCIYVNHEANYWHFKNLELCNAKDNGMKLEGSYHIVENCKFYGNNDTGLQIGMYKDFSIEETKSLPPGTPEFNPDYQFCKYNVVINCDAYHNYDSKSFAGTDDGGDADGFAAKLFPGPGTEFHGCRAWNNSDDNWDLYMVYHPIVINECWAWKGGYDHNNIARGNGNGFKLGGGGSAGGAAFSQSVGAHLVTNCIAFDNLEKGFDQNNAFEGMYLFNNIAWNNKYNYRFPTIFQYGGMYMRNNIGWGAKASGNVGNHEFLSADKAGSILPDTEFNSWTLIDGCDPYKENNRVDGVRVPTKDHSAQFKSLAVELAMAERGVDGSLPENDFCRLVTGSYFVDKGQNIENFTPKRFMQPSQANGLELITLPDVTINYNDNGADLGAFESGVPTRATLGHVSGKTKQKIYVGSAMQPVVYKWGYAATGVKVENLPLGVDASIDEQSKTVTIEGNPSESAMITISTVGGENIVSLSLEVEISDIAPATLYCLTNNATQTINIGSAIEPIVFEFGGGATSYSLTQLPQGLTISEQGKMITISGTPEQEGGYAITALGGMEEITISGFISRVIPTKVLSDGWYTFQESEFSGDYQSVLSLIHGTAGVETAIKSEQNENASGCSVGAIDFSKSGGGVEIRVNSLVELKVNLHFTGDRAITVKWSIDGGSERTWQSATMKKTTLANWDVMANAGIEATEKPIVVKIINTSSSGGMRLYDLFTRVYDTEDVPNSMPEIKSDFSVYQTESALIVQGVDVAQMRLYSLDGSAVAQSQASQLINIRHQSKGVHILQIVTTRGEQLTQKVIIR
ncbi:MAG: right-handed parallel beta-helix repeat-containing protein [Bacteroidales bacterium]